MSWHTGRLCLFDLETTGIDCHRDRIVTAAIIHAGGGVPTETADWLLNPGIPIPAEATAVHGITTEQALQDGQDPGPAVAEIAKALLEATALGHPVVGHNVVYDLTVLAAECIRHGHPGLAGQLRAIEPVIDTGVIEKSLDPYRPGTPETNKGRRPLEAVGSHKLIDCCRLWGVELSEDDAHGAAADALAAGRLAWRLATDPHRFEAFDGPRGLDRIDPARWPLAELHRWQAERFAIEARRFQSYKRGEQRRKPDPADLDPFFVAPTSWPVQEPPADWTPEQLPAPRQDAA